MLYLIKFYFSNQTCSDSDRPCDVFFYVKQSDFGSFKVFYELYAKTYGKRAKKLALRVTLQFKNQSRFFLQNSETIISKSEGILCSSFNFVSYELTEK